MKIIANAAMSAAIRLYNSTLLPVYFLNAFIIMLREIHLFVISSLLDAVLLLLFIVLQSVVALFHGVFNTLVNEMVKFVTLLKICGSPFN